jgi:predicted Zn-dependent protease
LKILINLIVIFYSKPLIALEIIRDPIFENYFNTIEEDQNINNVYLLKSDTPNAFVMGDYIYFTTDLLKIIEDEDALKSIYYH